jgi:hypothetical protein
MSREPFLSSRNAVPARLLAARRRPPFEIVFQALSANEPIVLHVAIDANAATMAFHEALAHLRTQRAAGEVLVRNGDPTQPPLVRHPFNSHQIHDGFPTHN